MPYTVGMSTMFGGVFENVSGGEKNEAIERIIQHASPRPDFFLMMVLAIAMATMGVLTGSIVILIGSMLIAPILYPLLSFSLGIVTADGPLLSRSGYTIAKSTLLSLAAAFVIAIFFGQTNAPAIVIISGSIPTLAYAAVAGIAGFAAAFAMTKEKLTEMLPGVAISVALVPPLAVAGIGLAHAQWTVFTNAFLLFFTNIVGVILLASVVFSLLGFATKRRVAEEAVKEETKEIQAEVKKEAKKEASVS